MSAATRRGPARAAEVGARLVLAGVFLYAAFKKIQDPPGFAHEIYNYRLLPGAAVNVLALWLPWIEIAAGLLLLAGRWRGSAAAILGALLVVFVAGLSWNLARGHAIECGCFGASAAAKTRQQLLDDMKLAILRDVGLLALCGFVLFRARRPRVQYRYC